MAAAAAAAAEAAAAAAAARISSQKQLSLKGQVMKVKIQRYFDGSYSTLTFKLFLLYCGFLRVKKFDLFHVLNCPHNCIFAFISSFVRPLIGPKPTN